MEAVTDRAESLPGLALSRGVLDRAAQRRTEPDLLARLLTDPSTRVHVVRGDRMQVLDGPTPHLPWRPPRPGDVERLGVFLGVLPDQPDDGWGAAGGAAVVAVVKPVVDPDPGGSEWDDSPSWVTLRQAGAVLPDLDAGIFTAAIALANWHSAHGCCSRCGAPTRAAAGGWIRVCSQDGSEHYPRTDPAVIMAVRDADDRMLFGRGVTWPVSQYSMLAGFVEPGESLEAAVIREVFEESGIRADEVTYLGSQPWPFPSSLMIAMEARALTTEIRWDPVELADARWMTREAYRKALQAGQIRVPTGISVARRIIERWLGQSVEAAAASTG